MGKQGKMENAERKEGPAEKVALQESPDSRTPTSKEDTDAKRRALAENNAWASTLPKGVRDSIRARDKKSLPRGYEERLKAYFEELD